MITKSKLITGLAIALEEFLTRKYSHEQLNNFYLHLIENHNDLSCESFFQIFGNPIIKKSDKFILCEKFIRLLKFDTYLAKYCLVLVKKNYFVHFPKIINIFLKNINKYFQKKTGLLISSLSFSKKDIGKLEIAISKRLNISKVELLTIYNESIKYGFIIKINNKVLDYRLSQRLLHFKNVFIKK